MAEKALIEEEPPEGRLASGKASETDAMGLDKRREVVGGSYRPSVGRQATLYATVLAVVAALTIGFILLANQLDQPPDSYADKAPWTNSTEPPTQPQ